MKESIRENFKSEIDLVNCCYMILKMNHVVKNQPLSLAYRMEANDSLLWWYFAQVNILNMVPHMRNTGKGTHPLLIWKPIVSNANNTLGLLADSGKFIRRWEGIESGGFCFDKTLEGWTWSWLASASLKLLSGGERDHEIDGSDLPRDDVLGT